MPVLVVAEHNNAGLNAGTLNTVAAAVKLGGDIHLLVAGLNCRAVAAVSPDPDRRPLAGDQLYVDLALGGDVLPPGSRLAIGTAVIEVTARPHRGCAKFRDRFGVDAMRFVNAAPGRARNLRGINAKVVQPGVVRVGDVIAVTRPT